MRVFLVIPPGVGHLHPLVGIGQTLKSAGHEVSCVSSASFAPRIEEAGFEALAAGIDWLEQEPEKGLSWLEERPALGDSPFRFVTDIFLDRVAREAVPDLKSLCEQRKVDLLIRTDYDFSSPIVAEMLDLPHVTVSTDFLMQGPLWRTVVGPPLAFLRRSCGLSPRSDFHLVYRDLFFSLLPPEYDLPHWVPIRVDRLRPSFFDNSERATCPAWLAQRQNEKKGRPLVYFSLGTVFNRSEEVICEVLEGLSTLDVDVVTTVGSTVDPADFGGFRKGIHIESYIPQSLILPYCDLVISHGGCNTLMASFAHGLPVLILPMAAHHPFHALRCTELGLGSVLRPRGLFAEYFTEPPPKLSPRAVSASVEALLQGEEVRQRTQEMSRAIAAMPGEEEALRSIEETVASRKG